MPLPIVIAGAGIAALASGAATAAQLLRAKRQRQEYEAAYARVQGLQQQLEAKSAEFYRQAEAAGQAKLTAAAYLRGAKEFLDKAGSKHPEFSPERATAEAKENMTRLGAEADLLRELMLSYGGHPRKGNAAAIHMAIGLYGTKAACKDSQDPNWRFAEEENPFENPIDASTGSRFDNILGKIPEIILAIAFPLPALLAASVWSLKNVKQVKGQVQEALGELAAAETVMARQSQALDRALSQITAARCKVDAAKTDLIRQLNSANPDLLADTREVYRRALDLSAAINAEALSPETAEILGLTLAEDNAQTGNP